jgi:hypothetical protein
LTQKDLLPELISKPKHKAAQTEIQKNLKSGPFLVICECLLDDVYTYNDSLNKYTKPASKEFLWTYPYLVCTTPFLANGFPYDIDFKE